MEGGIPEIPSVVAVFNVVADCIKHLLGCVNLSCIQNLVERGGVRVEKGGVRVERGGSEGRE